MLIESRLVGKIIGPRGATIQQLQNEYNVHISISKEDDAVSNWFFCRKFFMHREFQDGNRTAEVRGSDDDVQNAIAAIQERFCSGAPGGAPGGGKLNIKKGKIAVPFCISAGYQRGGGYRNNDRQQSGGYRGGYQQSGGYQGGQGGGYQGNSYAGFVNSV